MSIRLIYKHYSTIGKIFSSRFILSVRKSESFMKCKHKITNSNNKLSNLMNSFNRLLPSIINLTESYGDKRCY